MRAPVRSTLPDLDEAALFEIAHLHCVWTMTRGIAHALNNALTAMAGLVDAPQASEELDRELERCVNAARGLTEHHALQLGRAQEAELVGLVRRLGAVLSDALGSRFELTVEGADDFFYLDADPARIQLLLSILTWRVAELSERGGRMRLAAVAGEKPSSASLEFEICADDLPEDATEWVLDPAATSGTAPGLALEAAHAIVASCGGSLAARWVPGGLRVSALLPLADD